MNAAGNMSMEYGFDRGIWGGFWNIIRGNQSRIPSPRSSEEESKIAGSGYEIGGNYASQPRSSSCQKGGNLL